MDFVKFSAALFLCLLFGVSSSHGRSKDISKDWVSYVVHTDSSFGHAPWTPTQIVTMQKRVQLLAQLKHQEFIAARSTVATLDSLESMREHAWMVGQEQSLAHLLTGYYGELDTSLSSLRDIAFDESYLKDDWWIGYDIAWTPDLGNHLRLLVRAQRATIYAQIPTSYKHLRQAVQSLQSENPTQTFAKYINSQSYWDGMAIMLGVGSDMVHLGDPLKPALPVGPSFALHFLLRTNNTLFYQYDWMMREVRPQGKYHSIWQARRYQMGTNFEVGRNLGASGWIGYSITHTSDTTGNTLQRGIPVGTSLDWMCWKNPDAGVGMILRTQATFDLRTHDATIGLHVLWGIAGFEPRLEN